MGLIFVDVEAKGVSPINGTMAEFGAVDYKTRKTFHGKIWNSHPDPENPAKPILDSKANGISEVMEDFTVWIKDLGKSRPIFVSDNPAYDWQWISAAFDLCGMENPFGHSGRRISDFWAGLHEDFYRTQDWKSYRKTVHDHNPVNDSMGNVEAFDQILKEVEMRNCTHEITDSSLKCAACGASEFDAERLQKGMQKSSERTAPANASPSGPEAAQERETL